MLTGTAATSTAVAPPQAIWMPASQADDVVLPQLVRAMRLQLVGGVGEARIQLDPEHLGAVTVNLRVEGGVVSAVVTAEQSTVRQWIENHETSLRQALAEQGLLLGKLHVERDGRPPGDRPSHGQDDTSRRRSPRKDTATFELLA
jgi:flagellar hook-length control protein FliK